MGLYERLTGGESKIAVHDFGSATHLWLMGFVSNQRMIDEFTLDSEAQNEMVAIRNSYLASADKPGFLLLTHSVFCLCESQRMTKEEAAAVLGI